MIIDLGARLKSAFGYVAKQESTQLQEDNFSSASGINNVGVYVKNASFEELTLRGNGFELFFGNILKTRGDGRKIYAPPPMVSFSKSKNITVTEIDSTDAEVVECYGIKSWQIKLQGILIDMINHNYPKQDVIKLRKLFDTSAPFAVEAEMFDDLGIKTIFFTDVDISGVAGYEDTIQYTLTARSIKPVEFFLNAKNDM